MLIYSEYTTKAAGCRIHFLPLLLKMETLFINLPSYSETNKVFGYENSGAIHVGYSKDAEAGWVLGKAVSKVGNCGNIQSASY